MTESKRPPIKRELQAVKIARAAGDVAMMKADEARTLAFISRVLVQAFLPHSDTKELTWQRRNGNFTLTLKSGMGHEKGKTVFYGLPYGTVPRLLLAWLNSEAVKNAQDKENQNPRIINLGRSLSDFLEKIGVAQTGGKRGGITSFKKQAERLFRAEISVSCTGENYLAEHDMKVSDGRFFFWNEKDSKQPSLWESYIELSDRFYNLVTKTPVPLDWRILKEIKQSPMALDLYMWLTHRMSYLNEPVVIKWETLQQQFGADIGRIDNFRAKVRHHLKKIKAFWQDLNIDDSKSDGIYLYRTRSLVTPTKATPQQVKKITKKRYP
jgi:hypothetical protein